MSINSIEVRELQHLIADRIYIQIEKWNLYLGDAGLAEALAIECQAYIDCGASVAARKALEAVQVKVGGGGAKFPLSTLVASGQIFELEELLETYCR